MKKLLIMAFVASSMLLAGACSKDKDEQKALEGDKLTNTTWKGSASMSEQGMSVSVDATMHFATETTGTMNADVTLSFAGQSQNDNVTAPFTYEFDGQHGRIIDYQSDNPNFDLDDAEFDLSSDKTYIVFRDVNGVEEIRLYLK